MDQRSINKAYKMFNIPTDSIPVYTDAQNFSKNFKKCSVLKDVNSSYSSTSIQSNQYNKRTAHR